MKKLIRKIILENKAFEDNCEIYFYMNDQTSLYILYKYPDLFSLWFNATFSETCFLQFLSFVLNKARKNNFKTLCKTRWLLLNSLVIHIITFSEKRSDTWLYTTIIINYLCNDVRNISIPRILLITGLTSCKKFFFKIGSGFQ